MLGVPAKLVIAAGLMVTVGGPVETGLRPAPNVAVLYVGADDCAPCRTWRKEYWPDFAASPQFRKISYREVVSPELFALKEDRAWPEDLRHYRDGFTSGSGVPYWVVTVDGVPAVTAQGLSEWKLKVVRRINTLLR